MSSSKKRKLNARDEPKEEVALSTENGTQAQEDELSSSEASTTDSPAQPPPEEEPPPTFQDLGIIDQLCEACTKLAYTAPTPIQQRAIPLALAGTDIIGLAETGSGKTAAFALPILQSLLARPQPLFALVLAPTRELAHQTAAAFEALGAGLAARTTCIVGGLDMTPQAVALARRPHVVVATPGRLLDHLENTKGFSLRALKYLVLDEADRLLDMDFGPVLDKILKVLPRDGRTTMLFSATATSGVEALQRAALRNPTRVKIEASSGAGPTVKGLRQSFVFVPHRHKDLHLAFLLSERAGQRAVVFTRTVVETQRLAILLRALGFKAIPLHGQLAQSARLGALGKFRSGARDVLVATDVAARGLDVPRVDVVVNFDLPADGTTYVHRVGRTARAGRAGLSVSVVTQYDVEVWQRIEAALGRKLPEHRIEREEVMVLAERVGEAQRVAAREMRDAAAEARGRKGKGKGPMRKGGVGKRTRTDGMDRDEG